MLIQNKLYQKRLKFARIVKFLRMNKHNKIIKIQFISLDINFGLIQIMSGINRHSEHKLKGKYLIVPSELPNCQGNSSVKSSTILFDTKNSINSGSQIGKEQNKRSRKNSFKNTNYISFHREDNQEKNDNQVVKNQHSSSVLVKTISRLQDACTIHSRESPRSEKSLRFIFDQSIIILSGKNVENQEPEYGNENILQQRKKDSTKEPQRTKTIPQYKIKLNYLTLVCINSNLNLAFTECGLLFHFQFLKNFKKKYLSLQEINSKGLLKLYTVTKSQKLSLLNFGNSFNHKQCRFVALYQPYTFKLCQYIQNQRQIEYSQFLYWILQLLQTISDLFQNLVYPQIQIINLVMINKQIRIKIHPEQTRFYQFSKLGIQQSKNLALKSLGTCLSKVLKSLIHCDGNSVQNKLKGINLFKRMQLKQFIESMITNQVNSVRKLRKKLISLIQSL